MKIEVEINNLTSVSVNDGLVKRAARETIIGEVSDGRDVEVSIAIVDSAKIRQINKKYRKIDQITDVLSFSEEGVAVGQAKYPRIMGELVICQKQVKDDAKESGVDVERELAWVVVHGILHLFGYNHETSKAGALKMREKEEFYLSKLKL
jgi:probable rRNA maturation factor